MKPKKKAPRKAKKKVETKPTLPERGLLRVRLIIYNTAGIATGNNAPPLAIHDAFIPIKDITGISAGDLLTTIHIADPVRLP